MRLTTATGAAILTASMLLSGCGSSESPPGIGISTLNDTCTLLVGPAETFVDDALAAGTAIVANDGAAADKEQASMVQNSLFKIASTGPAQLQDLAGTLVDYLDDPAEYTVDGTVDASITEAADTIRTTCGA